jgi:hypothetical protein
MHRVLILYLPPKDPQASREYFVNTHIPENARPAYDALQLRRSSSGG